MAVVYQFKKVMRIAVIGLRGIPDVQGGIETHCQKLYPLIAAKGHEIYLFRRRRYVRPTSALDSWQGVNLIDLPAPHNKYAENIFHTFLGILRARRLHPDILHIHGIGPAILTPLAKRLGMKVVVTHHGRDYNRSKWGRIAKWFLRSGEKKGLDRADAMICVAEEFYRSLPEGEQKNKVSWLPNGYDIFGEEAGDEVLHRFGLKKGGYILSVGRLVKEKGFDDLIAAYRKSSLPKDHKLVIVGDSDMDSPYSRELKKEADENVVFTGRLPHTDLASLYDNAALFVLPSYHEGMPIVLLEAMYHRLPMIVSDIKENRFPEIPADYFFQTGNVDELSHKMSTHPDLGKKTEYDLGNYLWPTIAERTEEIYKKLMEK